MRRILLVVYIMLFAITANSEVYNFQAKSFSKRIENNDGSMSDWTEWNSSSVRINYDDNKDKIKIYSNEETLDFDVYEIQRETDNNGGNVVALSCVDDEGLKCTIDIRNAVFGGIQLYVRYANSDAVYEVEPPANIRKLFPNYVVSQTTANSVSSQLSGGKKVNRSVSSNSTPYLTLSQTTVYASPQGTTQTITVSSNRPWEIKYPTGSIYSVSRNGNTIIVKVSSNPTIKTRGASFSIQTTDGSKTIRVDIYQAAATSSSSRTSYSASRSNSSYGQNTVYQSPYRRYIHKNGVFEITWHSMRAGIGSGFTYSPSLLKMRLGPIQFSPLEATFGWNFYTDDLHCVYQPTLDFFIPISDESAIYVGGGPTYDVMQDCIWFKVETGWHWHWGRCASSDFFFRYDGVYCAGVSIQWSSGW